MILDSIKNAELYYSLNPQIKKAFEWLANQNPKTLPLGMQSIDGKELMVNVQELDLRPRYDAILELHRKYIDIQVILTKGAKEEFGWSESKDCTKVKAEYNSEKDIALFTDEPQTYYTMREGQFTILMPEDGHAPMLGNGHIKKAIFKCLIPEK